jgi:hypothetical protein
MKIQPTSEKILPLFVRFEIFMEVTMKNAVFRDVAPCAYLCSHRKILLLTRTAEPVN